MSQHHYTRSFSAIGMQDVAEVGGKNASLGEMYTQLTGIGIRVPDGFAVTAAGYRRFLDFNALAGPLSDLMQQLHVSDFSNLKDIGGRARSLLQQAQMPSDLAADICAAYRRLCGEEQVSVAVRSSATTEDLPEASFAGLHESFLHISGEDRLLKAVQGCFASLYTDRAIKYRQDNGFAHDQTALSAGVQKMVRSDRASSGIGFTLEPESGFRNIVHLSGVWGLGENIVQGVVTPDEFFVFKPMLGQSKKAVIRRKLGSKEKMLVLREGSIVNLDTPTLLKDEYVLSETEICTLARWAVSIEKHYGRPMDIEWAKDGLTDELFIVQARPETVHARRDPRILVREELTAKGVCLARGQAVGERIAAGKARVLLSPDDASGLAEGDIIVTDMTSPDWDPLLKKAGGIVTNKGGRTSHASIIARELGIPAIVGTGDATQKIQDGRIISVSCCEGKTGYVYEGQAVWKEVRIDLKTVGVPETTKPMLIVGDPEKAFDLSFLPAAGVGLMRMEFIISSFIGIHPMALVNYATLKDASAKASIAGITSRFTDKRKYFVDELAAGIATVAAAFYPREVIVRTSDFKTNEYAHLLGGREFEPVEENPMLGFRGASRYYHPLYKEGFGLECAAIKKVREAMGLTNVKVMIPFCRTVEEGKKVLSVMEEFGLKKGHMGLEVYVMAEIPSNVLLAADFAQIFDGFSIGSNDLTQLTLGIDRDSSLIASLFSEQDPAARNMIANMIRAAHAEGARVGLCGQAPSDYPDFSAFLIGLGIDSISFNPDALLNGISNILQAERRTKTYIL